MLRNDGTPIIIDPFWRGMSFWDMQREYMSQFYDFDDDDTATSDDFIPGGKKYDQWKKEQKQQHLDQWEKEQKQLYQQPKKSFNNNNDDDLF